MTHPREDVPAAQRAAERRRTPLQDVEAFNGLPEHVWPSNARRDGNGVVSIAGVPLTQIAEEYGTPVMVVDEDDFRSRCRDMATAFKAAENCALRVQGVSHPHDCALGG